MGVIIELKHVPKRKMNVEENMKTQRNINEQNFKKDIDNARKAEIECIVSQILTNEGIKKISPIEIVSLVKKHGFLVQSSDLPIDVTGYIAVNDNEPVDEDGEYNRLIVVNNKFNNSDNEENVVFKKSRFITAHEFGHFILHKDKNEPLYAHRDSDQRDTPIELEADYFARSVLMPRKSFLWIIDMFNSFYESFVSEPIEENKQEQIIQYLSQYFKVTKAKVRKRMEDIDFLKSITT